MNGEDENEGQGDEEIRIPPHLPVLDSPIKSGDNISDTSSVYEMSAPIKLSKFKTLLAGAMICVSEPVSETSDDDGNDIVVPLQNIKNHPDNQAFIFNPAEETAVLFTDDQDLDKATTSKINTARSDVTEELLPKVSRNDHDKTKQKTVKRCGDKVLRKSSGISYNEQSENDGDFSATDGSDYISDSDDKSQYARKTNRCYSKHKNKENLNIITVKALIHAEINSTPRVHSIVPETPDSSYEKDNTSNFKRPTKIIDESIEKDSSITLSHLVDKTYRSLDEILNYDAIDNNDIDLNNAIDLGDIEHVLEDDNTSNSKRPIKIIDESIEKDSSITLSHLVDKTYRSLDEILNYDAIDNNDIDLNNAIDLGDIEHVLEDITPSKPANQRSWDRRNCCLYCENLVTNFTRHLIRNHSDEIEVLKLMAIRDPDPKIQKKKRQVITDDLRNRGNYIHNSNVVSNNEGYLIPTRRKTNEELSQSPSGFVICKKCLGTYRRSTFYRHSKKCISNEDNMTKHALAKHALSIIPKFEHTSKEFEQNILPRLRNDEISLIVKQDPLIIAYGCRLLKKKKEKRSRKLICSKMRDLAHLLKIVREKNPDIVQLQNLIDPKYYECFIEAVKIMSGFNEETGHVEVISIPARIRPEILGCIDILFTNTIMDKHKSTALKEHIKTKLSEFKLLLEANWQWEVSSNAEKTRKRNLMTKAQVMPLEKDIEKVMVKIHELEEKYYDDLKMDITIVNYENLCEVTISHIILLDRKRSGDVAEAELQYYLNRKTDEIPPQVLEMLDKKQKQAISDLDLFQIPGKRGRSVPVLLTKVMRRNIDALIACRSTLNISSDYLFARPLTDKPFDGGRCLNKIKNMCNLKKPEMLTSTGLRHHIATISQVHSKTDDKYTQHLAAFLGHDMQVHASNYRLPIQAIQKGLVGSRLLEIEKHSKTKKNLKEKESESEIADSYVKETEEGCKQTGSDTHSKENETNKNKEKITEAEINDDIIEENESDKIIINEKNNKENDQQNESARYEERSGKVDFTKNKRNNKNSEYVKEIEEGCKQTDSDTDIEEYEANKNKEKITKAEINDDTVEENERDKIIITEKNNKENDKQNKSSRCEERSGKVDFTKNKRINKKSEYVKEIEEGCKQTDNDTDIEENETNKNKEKITEAEINDDIIEENESDKIIINEKNNKENDKQNESARCEERSGKVDFTKNKRNNKKSEYVTEINKLTIGEKKRKNDPTKNTSKQVQSSDTESSIDIPLQRRKSSKKKKYILTDDESDDEITKPKPITRKKTHNKWSSEEESSKKKKYILTDDESDDEITKPKPITRKKTHNKWSSEEVQAVMRHLKRFIQMKKNPGKALCEQVLRKEPVLHRRTWMQINTYINNIYKKNL